MEENLHTLHLPFLPFEWTEITQEIQDKAEKEINESEQKKKECLKEMKDLIRDQHNLKADTSDEFLLRYLRARKFNTENAFSLLKSYYKHRVNYPNLYCNFKAEACEKLMKSNFINFFPVMNADGSAICICLAGAWNPEEVSFDELLKFDLLCQEKALQNPVSQICGLVSLIDLKGLSGTHLYRLTMRNIRSGVSATQNCLPWRHRMFHVVNNPPIFSTLFALIKPLLNKKISQRIVLHGNNYESLHKYIPPSILPEEYGGTNGPFSNEKFYSELLKSDKEFSKVLSYGYTS